MHRAPQTLDYRERELLECALEETPVETRRRAAPAPPARNWPAATVGVLAGWDANGSPLVALPGAEASPVAGRALMPLEARQVGSDVALLFEGGDAERPIIVGVVQPPAMGVVPASPDDLTAARGQAAPPADELAEDRIVLRADREITLQCGKASITLTHAGKILIRGAYVLNRSTGVNQIKGGSVRIN